MSTIIGLMTTQTRLLTTITELLHTLIELMSTEVHKKKKKRKLMYWINKIKGKIQ